MWVRAKLVRSVETCGGNTARGEPVVQVKWVKFLKIERLARKRGAKMMVKREYLASAGLRRFRRGGGWCADDFVRRAVQAENWLGSVLRALRSAHSEYR